MANGVLCPECISFEENRQNSDPALAPPQKITKPYGWGKFQGVSLIVSGLSELFREPGVAADRPDFSIFLSASVFGIALGICILRRNRLILPLMGVSIMVFVLGVIGASLTRDELGATFAIGFVVWALCGVYYYNRRSEFKRWL